MDTLVLPKRSSMWKAKCWVIYTPDHPRTWKYSLQNKISTTSFWLPAVSFRECRSFASHRINGNGICSHEFNMKSIHYNDIWYVYIYTHIIFYTWNPNDHSFYWKRPCFGRVDAQKYRTNKNRFPWWTHLSPWSAEATDFFAELRKSPPKVRIVRKPRGERTIF